MSSAFRKRMDSRPLPNKPLVESLLAVVPTDQLVSKLIESLTQVQTSDAVPNKSDYLVSFLLRFKKLFGIEEQSEERQVFEKSLVDECPKLCALLLSNICQTESTVIKLASLQLILYLSHMSSFHNQFQSLGINLYMIRIIDLDRSCQEVALAVEYVRLLNELYPSHLEKSIIYCLLASLEIISVEQSYVLKNYILETLLEITIKNNKLALECNVYHELIIYIQNSSQEEFCIEVIVQCIIKASEQVECEKQMRLYELFNSLVTPLIHRDYVPPYIRQSIDFSKKDRESEREEDEETRSRQKIQYAIKASTVAVYSVLNKTIGMTLFTINNCELIKNLISPFSWYMTSNRRDAMRYELFVNKAKINHKALDREMLLLNNLMSLLYKLFKVEDVNINEYMRANTNESRQRSHSSIGNYSDSFASFNDKQPSQGYATSRRMLDLIDDDLVNAECDTLFESAENYTSLRAINPNLNICYQALLLKAFIEAGILEALIDLYYGLPVSFLQNYNLLMGNVAEIMYQLQMLSLRCLNLFAELYYRSSIFFYNEFCIDDFLDLLRTDASQNDTTPNPYNLNKSIYTETKKLALISYLKKLDFLEREKDMILYITEYYSRKEIIKSGMSIQTDEIARLSFFSQNFIANSGYLSSKDINSQAGNSQYLKNLILLESVFANQKRLSADSSKKKEVKDRQKIVEKNLDEQIDQTLVMELDSNIAHILPFCGTNVNSEIWNWLEILRLFESFLLIDSSLLKPKFVPTHTALFLNTNTTVLSENIRLYKATQKMFQFFIPKNDYESSSNDKPAFHRSISSQIFKSSTFSSNQPNANRSQSQQFAAFLSTQSNLFDLIACSGCYLIDFVLNKFQIDETNPSEQVLNSQPLSDYQKLLTQLLFDIKMYINKEFPSESDDSDRRDSTFGSNETVTRESMLSLYMLFLGHLSSSIPGDLILNWTKIFELLQRVIDTHKDLKVMKLVVTTFNFYTSHQSKYLLEKCLCMTVDRLDLAFCQKEYLDNLNQFKFYALQVIFNLYRANSIKFSEIFLEIIFKSLFKLFENDSAWERVLIDPELNLDQNKYETVIELSLSLIEYFLNQRPEFINWILESYYDDKMFIDMLNSLLLSSQIIKKSKMLSTKLRLLLFKFQMSNVNLDKIERNQKTSFVNEQFHQWYSVYKMDKVYFHLIERYLFDATSINPSYIKEFDDSEQYLEKHNEQPIKLYRRVSDTFKNPSSFLANLSQANLPFHINMIIIKCLTKHSITSEIFDKVAVKHLRAIKNCQGSVVSSQSLKSSLWSLAFICTSDEGFAYISNLNKNQSNLFTNLFDFISHIVFIAESHPRLSVRVTCFYCLNLITKSSTGANLLGKFGWHTFKSNRLKANELHALHSSIKSDSQDQSLEDDGYDFESSIDFYVAFYNINRFKSTIKLKNITNFYGIYTPSKFELSFLNDRDTRDPIKADDKEFKMMRNIDAVLESVCVPVRSSLISIDPQLDQAAFDYCIREEKVSLTCDPQSCFSCYLVSKNWIKCNTSRPMSEEDTARRDLILKAIDQLVPTVNSEEMKMKRLDEMKKMDQMDAAEGRRQFDFCMMVLVYRRYFSKLRLNRSLRKYLQEIFSDAWQLGTCIEFNR